jgi:hypothetical protein
MQLHSFESTILKPLSMNKIFTLYPFISNRQPKNTSMFKLIAIHSYSSLIKGIFALSAKFSLKANDGAKNSTPFTSRSFINSSSVTGTHASFLDSGQRA